MQHTTYKCVDICMYSVSSPSHGVISYYFSTILMARPVVAHLCNRVYMCGWACVLSDAQPMTPQGGEAEGRPVCTWLIKPTSKCARNHLPTNSINFTFPRGYLQATQRPFRSPIKSRDIWIWVLVNLFTYVLCLSFFDFCVLGVLYSNLRAENCNIWQIQLAKAGKERVFNQFHDRLSNQLNFICDKARK